MAVSSGVMLTAKGERYAAEHADDFSAWRAGIEAEIERLIGLLDAFDGDPDLEADEDFELAIDDQPHDANTSEDCEPDPGELLSFPNGSHIFGGGSGI